MRACYVDLSTPKKDSMVKSLKNVDGLPELGTDQFLTILKSTIQDSKLYKIGKEEIEKELQDLLFFGDSSVNLESMFPDSWLGSWLVLKNLLWENESEFVPGLCITFPDWKGMLETVENVVEEQYVLDEYGNKVVVMETITYSDGSTKTVPKTNPDGSYVYKTKFVKVVKGWITIFHGYGDRDFVYDVQEKKYYGQTKEGNLRNYDTRSLLKVFEDKYCALI